MARGSVTPVFGVVAVVLLVLAGRSLSHIDSSLAPLKPVASAPGKVTGKVPPTANPSGNALAAAKQLTVKGRAPRTGYSRSMFGDGWIDVDHNGCDTRNDILARDLTGVAYRPGTHDCVVASGMLADPYTRTVVHFVRGVRTSNQVQIDHVVALGDAWQKGAQRWPGDERIAFANDPLNLLAVSSPANQEKGDGDTATWLPRNKGYRCDYVARQVAVKRKYGVWVTSAERDAMIRVLSTCPAQRLPSASSQPIRVAAAPPPTAHAGTAGSGSTYYANCAAARAAGVAPLRRGDPGYRSGLDGDSDGIACE